MIGIPIINDEGNLNYNLQDLQIVSLLLGLLVDEIPNNISITIEPAFSNCSYHTLFHKIK